MQKKKNGKELKKILEYIKPRLIQYTFGIIGMDIAGTATIILLAYSLKLMIDMQLTHVPLTIQSPILQVFVFLIIAFIFIPITYFLYQSSSRKAILYIKTKILQKIPRLPLVIIDRYSKGDLNTRFMADLKSIEKIYSETLQTLSGTLFLGLGCLITMLVLEWRVSTILVISSILFSFISQKLTLKILKMQEIISQKTGGMTNNIIEIIEGFYTIKLFGFRHIQQKEAAEENMVFHCGIKKEKYIAVHESMNYMMGLINFVGAICISSFLLIKDATQLGTVIAIIILQMNISETFLRLGHGFTDFKTSLAGVRRIIEIMELPEEDLKDNEKKYIENLDYVECKDICFQYDKIKVLDRINLIANKGEITVITGPSGCGKSTLLKILIRAYEVKSGMVYLQGIPSKDIALNKLRDLIAFVPQNNYLFHGTIMENIMCGNTKAHNNDLLWAAKAANVHEFVERLPNGYDTVVEASGNNLSNGQCQRIALARALIKRAPILILDESTAYLDPSCESKILKVLKDIAQNSIVIIVSHRITTIKNGDSIYMMGSGNIIAHGAHADLILKNDNYKEYFENLVNHENHI